MHDNREETTVNESKKPPLELAVDRYRSINLGYGVTRRICQTVSRRPLVKLFSLFYESKFSVIVCHACVFVFFSHDTRVAQRVPSSARGLNNSDDFTK